MPGNNSAGLQRFTRIGLLRMTCSPCMLGERNDRPIGRLQKIFIGMGVDGEHAQFARTPFAQAGTDSLRTSRTGFPQRLRLLGGGHVPVHCQAVVVQQFDVLGILCRSAE